MSTLHSIVVNKKTVSKILKDLDISISGGEDGITKFNVEDGCQFVGPPTLYSFPKTYF
jgi:hypothetical protein